MNQSQHGQPGYIPFDDLDDESQSQPGQASNRHHEQQINFQISQFQNVPKARHQSDRQHHQQDVDQSYSDIQEEIDGLMQQQQDNSSRTKRSRKVKSIQQQQIDLENNNTSELRKAIRYRYCFRVFILILITITLMRGFYMIFQDYAFYEGVVEIQQETNIELNITNCKLNIFDSDYKQMSANSNSQFSFVFDSKDKESVNYKLTPHIALVYNIPGRFNIDPNADTSTMSETIDDNNYSYTFKNILSPQNCEIDLHIFKQTKVNTLNINCLQICYLMILATNITFTNVAITGELVESNIAFLNTTNLTYNSIQGRFQATYLDFKEYADIKMESGDIIVQADKDLMFNWTHSVPHFCLGAPVVINPIVVGCQEASEKEKEAYISGIGTGKSLKKSVKKVQGTKSKPTEEPKEPKTPEGPEQFFQEEEAGQIFLDPKLTNFNGSKKFQDELFVIQHLVETGEGEPEDINVNAKKPSSPKEILFQPTCYGNSLLCRSRNCTQIRKGLLSQVGKYLKGQHPNHHDRVMTQIGEFFFDENLQFRTLQNDDETPDETTEPEGTTTPKGTTKPKSPEVDPRKLADKARAVLPQTIPLGVRFLNVTARFGNIYINIVPSPSSIIDNSSTILHGISYNNDQMNFSLPSLKSLFQARKTAADPHNFDPSFIMEIGSKTTRSDTFQQWQVTYNPAYSYIRPWWIGTFSFTLMSTATFDLHLSLSPGFCPFRQSLSLKDIYRTRYLIDTFFTDAVNGITTIAWQNSVAFPDYDYPLKSVGVRKYIESNDEFERWYQVNKLNETHFTLVIVNQDSSLATRWAVYVSIGISLIMAAILVVGVIYLVNSVYSDILTQVASTLKYGQIEKREDIEGTQPLMSKVPEKETTTEPAEQVDDEESDDNEDNEDPNKKKKKKNDSSKQTMEIQLTFDPGVLIYQLLVLAPPLSAFIDFLCVLVIKKQTNSAKQFYTHLFQQKMDTPQSQEIHNQTTELMLGNDMKTLYEKFCYLNGYLEQKLDDNTNIKYLKQKGFRIETHSDAQTESYVKVLYQGVIVKLQTIPLDKDSLTLFIESCCKTTSFEEDNIVAQTFNEHYEEFCVLNHLQRIPIATTQLQLFKIESQYIPQQWVERDEILAQQNQQETDKPIIQKIQEFLTNCLHKCLPSKKNYYIDRQKMENHFLLIMNKPENIKTAEELTVANVELILYHGWQFGDILTVITHFITTMILIVPLFAFTVLEKILYAPFSLIPSQYIISLEDLIYNYWVLPFKLYNESTWIKHILIIVVVYWIYSIIDLIYYYYSMEFPQENFFKKVQPQTANKIQKAFRRIMWILVLYSTFQFFFFITLAAVWLMLGAIVNPTAFLPYATAAATFVVVISAKAKQFQEIAESGFQVVIDYVGEIAREQMGSMIKKFDLKNKMHNVMESDTFKSIAGQAANMGILNQETLAHLEQNAEQMLNDPEKAMESASSELQAIAADPAQFVEKMMKQLEDKALLMINEQVAKQLPDYGHQVSQMILSLFKKDQSSFKNSITQLLIVASEKSKIESLKGMGEPVLNLIWEFAYSNAQKNASAEQYLQQILTPCTDCVAGLLCQELSSLTENSIELDTKLLQICLKKAITLEKNITQLNINGIYGDFEEILESLRLEDKFPQIQKLHQYAGMLKVAMSLFENQTRETINFHKIFKIIETFFDNIQPLQKMKPLLGMAEIVLNTFKKQQKTMPTKLIRSKVQIATNFLITQLQQNQINLSPNELRILKNPSIVTLLFNFMQHHFDKLPKELLGDVAKTLFDEMKDCPLIGDMIKSEKEQKKFVGLLGSMFEFVGIYMEQPKELTKTLHQSAAAFSVDISKAKQLQEILAIKYIRTKCQESSNKEQKLFDTLLKNQIVLMAAEKLRLDSKSVVAIIAHLLHFHHRQNVQDLYMLVSKINQIDCIRVAQFFKIMSLYSSNNEVVLTNIVGSLNIPKEYVPLILITKGKLSIEFIDDESLIKLNVSPTTIQQIKENKLEKQEVLELLIEDVLSKQDDLVQGGNSKLMKQFLLREINQKFKQVTMKDVQDLLLALGNNQNQFAKLTQKEIKLLYDILILKNLDVLHCTTQLSSEAKQSIYTFANILNIDKQALEDLISIVFVNNPDRVIRSLVNIQNIANPFITESNTINYSQYLEFVYSKTDQIKKKHDFISTKFKDLFPMIKLPYQLVSKLIFNQHEHLDTNSYYQLAQLSLPKDDKGFIPIKQLQKLNSSIQFLTSTMSVSSDQQLKNELNQQQLSSGMLLLIQMLNEQSKRKSISMLINFLISKSKRNKNDDGKDKIPQIYHFYLCLYLFFSGQETDIMISYQEPGAHEPTQFTLIQYISYKLDIKIEFFETLYTYFLNDSQTYTQLILKLMRRLEACSFEQQNPGLQIPMQSLVRIPEQLLLNCIKLISGEDFQASYFAKELNLNLDLLMLISVMAKLCAASMDRQEIKTQLGYFNKGSSINSILSAVQVENEEMIQCIKIMLQDYDQNQLQGMLQTFGLSGKLNVNKLWNLLQVDSALFLNLGQQYCRGQIVAQFAENELPQDMGLPNEVVMAMKILIRGSTSLMDEVVKQLPFFGYPDCKSRMEYYSFISSLVGCISGVIVEPNFNPAQYFKQLFTILYEGIEKQLQLPAAFETTSNCLLHSVYILAKQLHINPMLVLLTQGNPQTWKYLMDNFEIALQSSVPQLNPIIVLQSILTLSVQPTLFKEIINEFIWRDKYNHIYDENFEFFFFLGEVNFPDPKTEIELEFIQKLYAIIFSEQITTVQSFSDICERIGFPIGIMKQIGATTNYQIAIAQQNAMKWALLNIPDCAGFNNQDFQKIVEIMEQSTNLEENEICTLESAIDSYQDDESIRQQLKAIKPQLLKYIIQNCLESVQDLFHFPDYNQEFKLTNTTMFPYFDTLIYKDSAIHQTLFLTELAQLRTAYWRCDDSMQLRDQEHTKMVTIQLDFILTYLERWFHYKEFMDYISIPRLCQMLGLSAGFVITAENMIQANCSQSVFSYKVCNSYYEQSKQPSLSPVYDRIQSKWQQMCMIVKCRQMCLYKDNRVFKEFDFPKILKYMPNIYTEPENYYLNSVQSIVDADKIGIAWEQYFYEIPYLQKESEYVNLIRYNRSPQFNKQDLFGQQNAIIEKYSQGDQKKQVERDFKIATDLYEASLITQKQQGQITSLNAPVKPTVSLMNTVDIKSEQKWAIVLACQQKWSQCQTANIDNFKLMIDIFKGNYQSVIEPDTYFMDEEPQAASAYYGILGLSGSVIKIKQGWKMNTSGNLSSYLNSCLWNTKSNKKNLQEILSVLFRSFDGWSVISSTFSQNPRLINSFVKLSCKLQTDQDAGQTVLDILEFLQLTEQDVQVLYRIIQIYNGSQEQFCQLAAFSQFITPKAKSKTQISLNQMITKKRGAKQVQSANEPVKNDQRKANQKHKLKYYDLRTLISKLLYSFDPSYLHKFKKIDDKHFNFINHTSITIQTAENSNQILSFLWQIAQCATQDTMCIDKIMLPSEKNEEYEIKIQNVQKILTLFTEIVKNDYSFILQSTNEELEYLFNLHLVESESELNYLRSLLYLKANKTQSINKQDMSLEQFDIQANQLVESNFINFDICEKAEDNKQVSVNIASMLLAINKGSHEQLIKSLIRQDSMSGCFVLTLFLWKNFSTIIQDPTLILENPGLQKSVFSAIKLLPLMIFSNIHEQQDIKKGQPRVFKRKKIINSIKSLVKNIVENLPDDKFYKHIKAQQHKNKNIRFSWSQWLIKVPAFLDAMRTYFLTSHLEAFRECEYLIKLLTGQLFYEKVRYVKLIGPMIEMYATCNKLINYPELIAPNLQLTQIVPRILSPIQQYLPQEIRPYVGIFDKFVELFVFIQIPQTSLQVLQKSAMKAKQDAQMQFGFVSVNGGGFDLEGQQEASKATDSENEQLIVGLILDVIRSTIGDLQTSFKQEHKNKIVKQIQDHQNQILKLKTKAAEMSMLQQPDSVNFQANRNLVKSMASGGFGKQLMEQGNSLLGAKSPSKYPSAINPGSPKAPPPPPLPEPSVFAVENKMKTLQLELQQLDQHHGEVKKLITAIIILLTGYNVDDKTQIKDQEDKLTVLYYIVDTTLFGNLGILSYINTTIIRQMYKDMNNIIHQPIISIQNKDFMGSIIQLLYTISGQNGPNEIMNKNKIQATKLSTVKLQQFQTPQLARKKIVEFPMGVIQSVFDLSQHNIKAVGPLLKEFKVGEGTIKFIDNIIHQVDAMGVFGPKKMIKSGKRVDKRSQYVNDLMKKIEKGEATPEDMFKAIDEDNSQAISKSEYGILAKRLGMNLSEHRINEIFASIKKSSSNDKDAELNQKEFAQAMKYLQSKNTNMALDFLGISPGLLTISLIILALILLLIFVFIFLGIEAFALGGTFGAIINSLMPIAAGGSASSKQDKVEDNQKNKSVIQDSVEKTQKIIQSDKI